MRFITLVAGVLVAGIAPAVGYEMGINQRLDHAIYAAHDPKLIVAGEIVEIRREPPPTAMSPDTVEIKFAIASVLSGKGALAGEVIQLPLTSFDWPVELISLEEEAKCILVLDSEYWKGPATHLSTVVPTLRTNLPAVADGEAAKRIIAEELMALLHAERASNRQRHLILQAAPILSAGQAEKLLPFLKSDDIWLRRAALGALAYTTKEDSYIKAIENDLKEFLEHTTPTDVVPDIEPPHRWAAYYFLFEHYFFLSTDWSEEETQAAVPFLALFRLIARAPHIEKGYRWRNGIDPLCRIGTKEDLRVLYECCAKGEIPFPSDRQKILQAVSRVLNLGLANRAEKEFLESELQQHQTVTEALIREGIITTAEAHNHPRREKP